MTRRGFLARLLLTPFVALLAPLLGRHRPAPPVVNVRRSFVAGAEAARLLGYTGPRRIDWEDGKITRVIQ